MNDLRKRIDAAEQALRDSFDAQALKMKQCDCCGKMKPDVTSVYISYVGDTSACEDCRNPQR